MNGPRPIDEAAALLDRFIHSDWASIHVRGGPIEFFVARASGHPNPMWKPAAAAAETPGIEIGMLAAPHLGTLFELALPGTAIVVGDRYGAIELLGEAVPLLAERAGTILRHVGRPGALVEYDAPLVALG